MSFPGEKKGHGIRCDWLEPSVGHGRRNIELRLVMKDGFGEAAVTSLWVHVGSGFLLRFYVLCFVRHGRWASGI
jgi:hypothetical protein